MNAQCVVKFFITSEAKDVRERIARTRVAVTLTEHARKEKLKIL